MRFRIAHQTEGRTRLRADLRPVDQLELSAIADGVAGLSGVESVDCRPTTGSLVIEHPELDWADLVDDIARGADVVFTPADGPVMGTDGLAPVRSGVAHVNGMLTQLTAGNTDMRTLSFILMFAFALRQIMRGQVMVPAMSFLWYAFEILNRSAPEHGESPDSSTE